MKKLYVVTGADGHLGSTIIRLLLEKGEKVRGLILPGQTPLFEGRAEYVFGDVTKPETLPPLFERAEDEEIVFIHTAGIISIADKVTDDLLRVNVEGTENLLSAALGSRVKSPCASSPKRTISPPTRCRAPMPRPRRWQRKRYSNTSKRG